MSKLVYLAGPITGMSLAGANGWRQTAKEYLAAFGISALDPLRGKDYLNSIVGKYGVYAKEYSTHPMSTAHGITHRDRWDATRCDLMFVYFPKKVATVSIGTVMEIAWASLSGVYILAVMDEENIHNHGMLTESCSLVLPSFEEALELIPVILGKE